MAQEPSSRDLLEAVKQQESGGRRYDKSGKLLEGPMTKYGTAKGEMQVLDLTTKDPGYGVKPARDDSPDERARVGRDYLAAMVKRYGDEKTALVAYNWGPGNTDRWLKKGGDFSRLPKETQNYVAKVTGSLGSTKLAQAPATTKVKKAGVQQAVYKAAPLSHPMLSQLGPNFQAAMAVSMLADEAEKEGKSEDEPSEAEKMLTQATVQPVALASVDLGYQSPFPAVAPASSAPAKQQLQAFKHGGVVRMENGGDPQVENKTASLEGADLPVSRSAKELKSYTEAMNPAVKVVTDDLGAGTRGQMLPSQPDVLELNYKLTPAEREVTTLHELEHSMDARGGDIYGRPNFAKMGGMDNNYRAYHLMGDDWGPITETVKNMVDNREKLEKFFGRPLDNSYFNKQFYNSVKEVQSPSALFKEQLASLAALEQTTGKFLTQDPEMRKLFPNTRMMAVFDALTGPRQTRLDARDLPPHTPVPSYTYETNPALRFIKKALTGENEYGTSYRPFPIKRANGGEVDYFQDPMGAPSAPVTADTLAKGKEFKAADALRMAKEFGTALGSNTESLVRGAVAQVPGAVGDLESLSRKGINFLYGPGGVNVSEKTVAPTSEEIRARVPRITATRPESSGMESMGELMAPGLAKAAAPVAKAAAKGTAKEMLRGMEGQGVLAPISPQESIMYAVRNKTTPFVMTRRPDTSVDAFIDEMSSAEKAAFREKYPDVNFFDDKGMQGTQEYKNFIKLIDEPEHLVRYELRPVPGTIAMENLRKDPIVREWFNRTIPKYLRKDFATEEDQLVKAADQGKLLHFAPKKGELKEGAKEYVEAVRRAEGFSSQGEAKEPYGKYVEALVDQSVYPSQLQDIGLEYQIPPSLVKFLETNPEKRVSELAPAADKLLKLFELRKDMLRIRQIGPEYSAYGQPAETIPTNFTLPDNLLPRFNLAEVSNRVARFTRWEDETRSRMATSALREDPQLTRNYLQDGKYISVALPDPVKKPAYKSLITDVGCDGGWCTAQEQNALSYGSGKSQLHVLVTGTEKNARPVAQVSVEEIGRDLDGRPKYSITDIKEKGNTENFKTNPALPAIQEQVKLLDNQYGGFKGVHALEKLGMAEIPKSTPKWLADSVPLTQPFGFFKGVREEAIRLNGGSQYVIGEKEDATSLVQQAYKNLFGPIEGFAKGGMVERQVSTARYI